MLTSEQIRAARALLHWDVRTLAEASQVSRAIIERIEEAPGLVQAQPATIDALSRALRAAGIELLSDDGVGTGVRLRRVSRDEGLRPEELNAQNDD